MNEGRQDTQVIECFSLLACCYMRQGFKSPSQSGAESRLVMMTHPKSGLIHIKSPFLPQLIFDVIDKPYSPSANEHVVAGLSGLIQDGYWHLC